MAPPAATIETFPETDTSSFTIPDRLSIQSVAKRRAASGKLIAGIAAPADIEAFKGRTQHLHKKNAKDWNHRLNDETKMRMGSRLKGAASFLKNPGLISLGGGLPSSEYFPFNELDFHIPAKFDGSPESVVLKAGKHDQAEDKSLYDISTAFQYGLGHGSAQLLRWLIEHTEIVHDPPYKNWGCNMTIGSTSSFDMAMRMFCKHGDFILTEEFTFPAAVETALPMGIRCANVSVDKDGMLATSLDDILTNWDEKVRGGPKPFVVYTVPTGQNPTGSTQPLERRQAIYAVAQKHDLYILEDEPYYFLQMQPYTGPNKPDAAPPASHEDFLKSIVPSFLSLDVDGRVMRMDSFSKVIAPGSRVGWITASEQIIERYKNHADLSTQGPSGVSQLMLFKLLEDHWGHAGYLDWLMHIRKEYTQRRDVMMDACERYLPKDLVSWVAPTAGMFHWMRIEHAKHPEAKTKSLLELEDEIFLQIIDHGTLLMKGSWFCADQEVAPDAMFFRATYAAAEFGQIEEAIKRLGEAIRQSFGVAK